VDEHSFIFGVFKEELPEMAQDGGVISTIIRSSIV
jgi:coenzyme F420-reducing hydrogenase beta subunit